jgi:uncharacterized membrane protein
MENDGVNHIYLALGTVHWQVTEYVVTNTGLVELLLASHT